MSLKDKVVVITGASSGIGEACAKLMAKEGAIVVLIARSADRLAKVAGEVVKHGGSAFTYPADLTDIEIVRRQAGRIRNEVGVPDMIINSAGAGNWLSIFETSEEEFTDMMAAPYFATIHTVKAFLPDMVKRNRGHIITLNSPACYFIFPGALGYSATRWATRAFQEGLAEELRSTGIAVTSIIAAKVDSPYFKNNPVSAERIPGIATSLMKTLTVEDVAFTVWRATRSRRRTIIVPWQMSLSVFLNRFFPGIFKLLMRATGYKGIPDEISRL
ncbi:MAG: SDR family NAD(P)-dependent oxidoreductase [Cytophagales bacterium]|nr:SDR family NAD(P)-dependent oxidoreductase [Cytophagales bacterium]